MKAYFDNGATTPADPKVLKAMEPYFTEKFGNASSLHSFGREAHEALDQSRRIIADAIGAEPSEIIFTSGGSESDNLAIKGVAFAKGKGHIITSKIEHHAVLNTCKALEKLGFKVTYLPVDSEGFVKPETLKKAMTKDTILVTIMHANNEIGTIEPIAELARIAHKGGAYFHTDAVQSFTKVPINVRKMDLDLVSLSAHKIHGPKGVGALFVRKGIRIQKLIDGGGHEFDLRAGTENIPGIVGFAKAAQLANQEHIKYMTRLRDRIINELLKAFPDAKLNGPKEDKRLCNNINISFSGVEGESVLLGLDALGIAVSTGSACSSKSLKPSHVLTAIGRTPIESHGSIRITLSRMNTEKEVNYLIKSVIKTVKRLKEMSPL